MIDNLEKVLVEVERNATDIKKHAPELDELAGGIVGWTLERSHRIRSGDMLAAVELGQRLAEIREYGDRARLAAKDVSPVDRSIRARVNKATERYAAYIAALNRGFSPNKAYREAAKKLGVDKKTIMRAVNGEGTKSVNG